MTDKILTEAFDKLKAIEEAASPEEAQINVLVARMRRATEEDDEAAYHRAVDQLNALTDEMNAEQQIKEGRMEDEEGIDVFEDVQQKLFEVIEELDSAIRAYAPRSHSYWQSYGLAQLKVIAGSDEYASRDKSINNLIQDLKDELGGEEDDEDDWGKGQANRP